MNLVEDIKTVSELKARTKAVLGQVRRTGRPVVVTVNGKPDVVIVDALDYERQKQALNLAALLAEGEADVRAGRVRPAREFLKDLERRASKVPR
jgi:prevent-host-death family protein